MTRERFLKLDTSHADRDDGGRPRWLRALVTAVAVSLAFFHLYTGWFGQLPAMYQRNVHWAGIAVVAYLTLPLTRAARWRALAVVADLLAAGIVVLVAAYVILNYIDIVDRIGAFTALDLAVSIAGVVLVLEATRRSIGLPMLLLCLGALAFAFLGSYLPGFLAHRGYDLERVATHLYLTTEGIMGSPIAVSASYILLFSLFGEVLNATGAGSFFINLAYALTGWLRGGPAQTAVVASGFFGSISGSAVANVVTTGTFTIPLMKRIGYPPAVAGAVEALASTGGQLAPPVMGAAAFVLAEIVGIPYLRVMTMAALPAFLYYAACAFAVHHHAARLGLKGVPRKELPALGEVLKSGFEFFVPIVVLVWLMVLEWSPARSVVASMLLTIAMSVIRPEHRVGLRRLVMALESGVRQSVIVAVACAAAGIVVGVVSLTGVGLSLSGMILSLSGQSLFLGLFMTMIASVILGMGMPTTASYVILAVLAAPALVKLGGMKEAVHLFILYFGVVSNITPPVALAAYAAAGIAGGSPMKIGWEAVKMGIAAYIIPFMFVFSPALLLMGSAGETVWAMITATAGAWLLAIAAVGWGFGRTLPVWARVVLLGAALSLIKPGVYTDLLGAGLAAAVYGYVRWSARPLRSGVGLPGST